MMGADASKKAADAQIASADRATQAQLDMYGGTVAREQPFLNAGTNALGELQKLLGLGQGGAGPTAANPILQMLGLGGPGGTGAGNIDPSKFQGSPGYRYQVQEGLKAVTNSNARGGLGGNALRELQSTGQGLANQNWNQYLGNASNSWQQMLANLSNLSASGQNAAGLLGTTGTNVANSVGGNMIGAGNSQAAGIMGGANAMSGGINSSLQGLMTAMQSPAFQNMFKSSTTPASSSGGGMGGISGLSLGGSSGGADIGGGAVGGGFY